MPVKDYPCSVDACDRPQLARLLCKKHYDAARRAGQIPGKPCSLCDLPVQARGFCNRHYAEARNRGDFGTRKCAVEGCDRAFSSGLYCATHATVAQTYGLTTEQMSTLKRGVPCEACGDRLANRVDHDHVTGEFRGFLCHGCNAAEGLLGTPERAISLSAYMRKHALV